MGQVYPKTAFPIANEKSGHHHWILHIGTSLSIKFYLKLIILNFWTKKSISGQKWKKWTTSLNSAYSNQSRCQMLASADNFDIWDKICTKRIFLHIRIRLDTKFSLKLTILIFWTKFTQKKAFPIENKKVNNVIEFFIFKLV